MLINQHLIDPEICIRCNSCEESCPRKAITHDQNNYVVDASVCEGCGDCLGPCPTGAISNWRQVLRPYSLDEQLGWLDLPPQEALPEAETADYEDTPTTASSARPPPSAPPALTGVVKRADPLHARVLTNLRLTAAETDNDVRHLVLDLGDSGFRWVEGQSVGVLVPGLDGEGRPHAVRMYSIASPRDGEAANPKHIALCVKRDPMGLCSRYLCDLDPGAVVDVIGPFGTSFLLPDDPGARIVMIGVGTGVAPFRAFVQRLIAQGSKAGPGPQMLIYGGRRPEEMAHHDWLMGLPAEHVDVRARYSRKPGTPKGYAQDALTDAAPSILNDLAQPQAHLYLCGIKELEAGVDDCLGLMPPVNGRAWSQIKQEMRLGGRYQVEVF